MRTIYRKLPYGVKITGRFTCSYLQTPPVAVVGGALNINLRVIGLAFTFTAHVVVRDVGHLQFISQGIDQ